MGLVKFGGLDAVVCTVSLIFSVAGSVVPEIVLTVPANGLAIGSKTVLLLASSLVPALVLFIWFPESRSLSVYSGRQGLLACCRDWFPVAIGGLYWSPPFIPVLGLQDGN